jgi:hypothetical protein
MVGLLMRQQHCKRNKCKAFCYQEQNDSSDVILERKINKFIEDVARNNST